MRKAESGALVTRRPRINTGRRKGASILSIVTLSFARRAFHEIHSRSALLTISGEKQIASSTAKKTIKLPSKIRFLSSPGLWRTGLRGIRFDSVVVTGRISPIS